jgi:SAM-dependent methyltransferase
MTMTKAVPAYQTDLAYIHDVGHGAFARNAAPGVLRLLRQGGITQGLVVDLGCGSGIWAEQLCQAGYQVFGVDISAAMIRLARRRAPQARFTCASLLQVELPPCDAVTSLGECVNFLFDPKNSREELVRLFGRVYGALRSGGMFIFDVAEPGRSKAGPPQRCRQGEDWAVLVEVEEDPRAQRLTRRITSFRRVGKLYRRSEETHRLQLYRGAVLAQDLRRLGFRVRLRRGYGAAPLGHAYVALIARKP